MDYIYYKISNMKKIYLLVIIATTSLQIKAQSVTCDTTANVIIYSNYDGGTLNINVDKNIPNLKIGVTTYEAVKIAISGPFAGNVTEVRYAGYNGTNDNCSQGVTNTSIAGVAGNLDTIILYPPAGYSNPNGYQFIICNYSCSNTTNQGGCNTPDQIVYYYTNAFGGTLNYHHTQYGCWSPSSTYSVSAGGNCCIMPGSGVSQVDANKLNIFPNPATNEIHVEMPGYPDVDLYLTDVLGNKVAAAKNKLGTAGMPSGIYFIHVNAGEEMITRKIVIQH